MKSSNDDSTNSIKEESNDDNEFVKMKSSNDDSTKEESNDNNEFVKMKSSNDDSTKEESNDNNEFIKMKSSNDDSTKESNDNNEQKLKICNICGKKYRFLKALQKHEARHEGTGGFICRTCGMCFTTSEAREKHRDKEHKVLRCKICSIRYDSESEYLHHINSMHEGRDRELSICSECGKQFKTKGELSNHVSSKCGTIKQFQCSVCHQNLMTAGSLHNHMLRHSGKQSHMCRFCAKTFLTAGQLTVHERIHTQEKAFVCQVCHKGFCHRQSLITHSTLHTGVKPYQCEGCGNAFSCVGNLLKHRKTHADSCGKIPLTTHRVKHPVTKIKVHVNTPPNSKLKTLEKQKKIAETVQMHLINTQSWQQDSTSNSNSLQNNENQTEQKLGNNKKYININNVSHDESDKSLPSFINDLPLETNLSIKQENWIPPTEFGPCPNNETVVVKFENEAANNIFCRVENGNLDQNNVLNNNSDDNNAYDDWGDNNGDGLQNGNDSDTSNDSLDLYSRKLKWEEKNKQKTLLNKKKVKNRRKSAIDRAKIEKFIKERGFEEGKELNCKYCGSQYSVPLWLMKHEEKHETSTNNDNSKDAFKCSCCNQSFPSRDECLTHQQSEHADQLTCKECDRMFRNPDGMKAHINFYHKGVPRKKYVYVCEKCGKVFKQKALLINHEQSNCGEALLYQCDICEKNFSSKHVKKSHMRVHLPEKLLLCKFCGKSFHWKGQLKIHERSHTGERPFQCQYCPKTFAYRESLITHSTLHTGIKKHLCEACGSRFSCIGNLLKHRRTHANTCGAMLQVKTEIVVP